MWATVIVGGLLCLSLTGGSRRVDKPLRSPAEENKRLYLQHFFGEDGREEPTRKGGSTMFAAQQSYTYPRSGGGVRNGGVQEFSPKRSKPRKPGGGGGSFNHDHSMPQLPRERKPNIILILTDDQDVELGSLNFMPRTQRLLRNEGAEFRHAYVTTPMCCPSRSSMLTGMLVHNHQVFTNNDNCSGTAWQATHETRTFATYLSNAGYRTGYIGKYLNKYNGSHIPPGWREWAGLIMNSRYYNYSINVNGKRIKHGADYHRDYYPDLIANDSIAFLRQSKQSFSRKPVMLVMSFPAPHGPEDSAPQYSHLFFNVTTHHTPSYDYAPNPDKQWILRVTGRMQPIHKHFTDMLMTKRLQTLQSVDAAVQRVYDALEELGELENTYIVYTSDHGYHLGQFGLVKGKSFPFEFDIRVPFLVRGPGVEPGTIVDDIVLNVDLAPTFLDIAGVEPPAHMDGRSLLPLLHRGHKQPRRRRSRWPDTFLVESSGRREMPSHNNKFGEGVHSKVARLNRECLLPAFQHPCKPGQKWTCVKEEGRWRKHKCKFIKHPPPPPPPALIGSESTWGTSSMFKAQMGRRRCTCFPPSLELPVMHPHPLLARLDQEERRMQRNFLRTHLSPQHEPYKPRFLKQPSLVRRRRRSLGHLADSLNDLWSLEDQDEGGARQRRSLSALLDSLLGGVSQQLKGLEQQSNDTAEEDAETEQGALGNSTVVEGAKCRVMGAGQVNCSRAVYKNSKVWRQSKQHIDEQINKLREQLEALKEIRRHLRHKRPPPRTHGEDTEDPQGSSEEDLSSEDDQEEEEEEEIEEEEEEEEYPDTTLPPRPDVTTRSSITTVQPVTSTSYSSTTSSMVNFVERTTAAYPEVTTAGYNYSDVSSTSAPSNFPSPSVRPLGNSKLGTTLHHDKHGNVCICEPDPILEARRRQKEQRLRRKERKMRRKARMESECLSEKMNCFTHDNSHWRTAPLWTEGPFCVCMNANNNTYSCIRTINATHNFLFCEFTTGLITYYNLRIDPFEQNNRAHALSSGELEDLRTQLKQLKACRGARECRTASPPPPPHIQQSTQEQDTVPPPEQHQQGRRRSKTGGKQNFERLRHRQDHTFEPPF